MMALVLVCVALPGLDEQNNGILSSGGELMFWDHLKGSLIPPFYVDSLQLGPKGCALNNENYSLMLRGGQVCK